MNEAFTTLAAQPVATVGVAHRVLRRVGVGQDPGAEGAMILLQSFLYELED